MLVAGVLVAGLAVFGVLSLLSRLVERQTERRLLEQQTQQAASVLTLSVAQLRAPLEGAARSSAVTDGDVATFAGLVDPLVAPTGAYASVTLFDAGSARAVAHVGAPLVLAVDAQRQQAMLGAASSHSLVVVDLLDRGRTIGYAVPDRTPSPRFIVYAERTLNPPGATRRTDQPFAQLDYAIYLGDTAQAEHLLGTSLRSPPVTGLQATVRIPFGNTELLLVTTPIGHLSGGLPANLWWIVLSSGAAITLGVALLLRSIVERGNRATRLASENAELYERERHVAETLQLGLLPRQTVPPAGTSLATRYWPAGVADLIGGDFFDVFFIDDDLWGVVIGDVCGKGVEAASATGLARHSLRTAARFSLSPSAALEAVRLALVEHDPTTFCTICFAVIHLDGTGAADLTIALGGHPQPLLARLTGGVEAIGTPGTLVGLVPPRFTDVTVRVEPGDMLFLYTDGLTDAPGQEAVPLSEVEAMLADHHDTDVDTLADLIRTLKRQRRPDGSHDDTAVVLLRFADPSTAPVAPVGDHRRAESERLATG
jgi:serine phosphatase RsbU (regulator of sigma subunit)